MSRLEKVIEQVKESRKGNNRAWIFDENGNIKDNVIIGEVLDILEELKNYEINVSDEYIENFKPDSAYNTYNYGGNISNDLNYEFKEIKDGVIIRIMVHLYGDIRGGYSDYFFIKMDSEYDFLTLESIYQSKDITDILTADIHCFSECYNVYDYEKQEEIGEFYCLEKEDLLKELNKIYWQIIIYLIYLFISDI